MNWAELADPLGAFIGFILTVLVFSYIIGDNVLFRIVMHLFIGVATGYAAVLVVYNILWYQLVLPLIQDPLGNIVRVVPAFLLGLWLLTKMSPRLARWGNPVMAYLVGVGAAVTVGGAIVGTIFPQVSASAELGDLGAALANGERLEVWFGRGAVVLIGTITTLGYFHFSVRPSEEPAPPQRHPIITVISTIGEVFIAVTFGALFAGVYIAALAALIERVHFIWDFIIQFLPG